MTIAPTPNDASVRDSSDPASRPPCQARWIDKWLQPGRPWVCVSLALYVLACALPAMPPIFGTEPVYGYVCLIAALDIYTFPPWWANPTYFVAVLASLLNRPRIAVVFAVVAALLAVGYELDMFYEGGVPKTLKVLLPGCLLWITSLQLLACHELWRQWLAWRQRQLDQERGVADAV